MKDMHPHPHKNIEFVIPNWNDPKVQATLLPQIANYAIAMGFDPAQVKSMRDRKIILAMYKAMMFDRNVSHNARINSKRK